MKLFKKLAASLCLALAVAGSAHAQATADDLVGLCAFDGGCATYIADNVAAGATLSNAAWLTGRNQAGSADINMLRVDTSDNTVLNADTGDDLIFSVGGTTEFTLDSTSQITGADDLLLTAGSDDVILTAVDDLVLQGGGSGDLITLAGGGTAVDLTVADNVITIADGTALDVGNALGWDGAESTNQACSTTCGSNDCVIGWDGTNFVTCADATADVCLCDGS